MAIKLVYMMSLYYFELFPFANLDFENSLTRYLETSLAKSFNLVTLRKHVNASCRDFKGGKNDIF